MHSATTFWARVGRGPRIAAVIALLLLAVVSALGSRHATAQPSSRTTAVALARRDLPAGSLLRATDIRLERWPEPLARRAGLGPATTLVGRRLAGPVARGEPLTADRLVDSHLTRGLRPGLVAATVPLADPHSTALVQPGQYIDLLATLDSSTDSADSPYGVGLGDPDAGTRTSSAEDTSAGTGSGTSRPPPVRTAAQHLLVLAILPGGIGTPPALIVAADRPTVVRITEESLTRTFTAVLISP